MPKIGELDWSDLMKGNVGEPEHPLSKTLERTGPILKKGEIPRRPSDEEIRAAILANNPNRQPTDEELFGHLVRSKEQLKKAEDEWENSINDWYKEAQKPVDNQESNWATGKSFNETLTPEELAKRNMFTGDE